MHTAKGSSRESSVRGKGRASAGLLQRLLSRPDSAQTEGTRLPGPLAGVCSPAHPEADSLGAQQLSHTRSFPNAPLPSRDVCSWLGPAPACLGSHTAPAQGKQPLSQDLQEAQSAPTWKPSEQQAGGEPPRGKRRQPSLVGLKPCLAGAECASRTADLQLCSEARCGRVAVARLPCPGRALPRLASLIGILTRKEQAARG